MPQEKPVVHQMYDLIKWLMPQIAKLPRSHKFTLGDRITNLALDTLDLLIQAVYTRRRLELLQRANLNLERLRYMAHEQAGSMFYDNMECPGFRSCVGSDSSRKRAGSALYSRI